MKKVAFIAFSDIQIEDWKRHSVNHSRFDSHTLVLNRILELCMKHKCPALFMGDLFDNPRHLDNYVLSEVFNWFNKFKEQGVQIYAISGNHDQCDANYQDKQSPSYIEMMASIYPNFHNMDFKSILHGEFVISGIPYITGNVGFEKALDERREKHLNKKHILLIHTDLWGARDSFGREVGTVNGIPRTMGSFFKGFDLVLSGHIHVPQQITPKILMVGATHQQRVSDMGTDMKIWKIYNDLSMSSIRTDMPQFLYEDGEHPNDTYNMIIPPPIKENELETIKNDPTFKSDNPIKLAKSFMKAKGIKSKAKLNLLLKYLKNA